MSESPSPSCHLNNKSRPDGTARKKIEWGFFSALISYRHFVEVPAELLNVSIVTLHFPKPGFLQLLNHSDCGATYS